MIPDRYRARCELDDNHHEIDIRGDGVYQWTQGWVLLREGGGGHGISCPERANRWACRYHVERAAKGLLKQDALL